MINNIKMWLYSISAFIILSLSVWVKVLNQQNETLEKDLKIKDKSIKETERKVREVQEVREEEKRQNDIISKSEEEKDKISSKTEAMIKESNGKDIKVSL